MYQPNFCAECGQRIERARWHWWTSRKFCSACARRLRRQGWTLPVIGCAALAVAGFAAGRAGRPAAPPLTLERAVSVSAPSAAFNETPNGANRSPVNHLAPRDDASDTVAERPIGPNEVVSMCGARTKKGTPCQRRVRGTGRCFQHLGKPAMLPAAKLIVQGGTT